MITITNNVITTKPLNRNEKKITIFVVVHLSAISNRDKSSTSNNILTYVLFKLTSTLVTFTLRYGYSILNQNFFYRVPTVLTFLNNSNRPVVQR